MSAADIGTNIVKGLREAIEGRFQAVTIDGVRWVRDDGKEIARLRSALVRIRDGDLQGVEPWEVARDALAPR